MKIRFTPIAVAATFLALANLALAQEDVIRKNLAERLSQFQSIDEVTPAPLKGLYEVRINGTDIFYTDANGDFLIEGAVYDTRQQRNLTQDRIDKLTAVDFKQLQWQNSFKIVRGDGKRQVAMFVDPNCGYCKRMERDILSVNNITIHVFLFPILSQDSVEKSKVFWCAKDKGKTWQDWMVRNVNPSNPVNCDTTVLERNLEFGHKYHINGTPTLIFTNNTRIASALTAQQLEEQLHKAKN